MDTLTPLLSKSFKEVLIKIKNDYDSKIAADLLFANEAVETHNKIIASSWCFEKQQIEMLTELCVAQINKLVTDEVRALSIRRDVFEVSFTPKGKELKYSAPETWSREGRQTGKPGRIIKKLLVYDYKERDIEIFSNQLKSSLLSLGEFKIVQGNEICYWYDRDNYHSESGTLGNSCMRYDCCKDYFQVYKDHAKMLVCIKDGKLLGRAILWEIDGQTYMDRVYVCMDFLEESFYQHAIENKWIVRDDNHLLNDGDDMYWSTPDDNYTSSKKLNLVIELSTEYQYFPYMDSFRYYDPDSQELYCCVPRNVDYCSLSSTEGYWREDSHTYVCAICGHTETCYDDDGPEYMVYSDWAEEYYCDSCSIYSEYMDDYYSSSHTTVTVHTINGDEEVPRSWAIYRTQALDIKPIWGTILFKIDDEYYDSHLLIWDDTLCKYVLINEDEND